jgi:prepilin-type N-terminal cleavage/methylation domain-containing protein
MMRTSRAAPTLLHRAGRFVARSEGGYTLAELLVVIAVIGIMAFIAVPFVLTYTSGATIDYAARELRSGLNRAKLMAVTTRQPVCVQPTAGGYRFYQNTTCNGTPWTGPGTDANGVFSLANRITVALAVGANPVFNQFGVAVQTGTLRVTGPTGRAMTVSVQASGRVTTP